MDTNLFTFGVTAIDVVGSIIIVIGLSNLNKNFKTPSYIIGFICTLIGLASQALRNIYFFKTGIAPIDSDLPIWVLKDIGILIIALTYIMKKKDV
jgi:hypothetical protein